MLSKAQISYLLCPIWTVVVHYDDLKIDFAAIGKSLKVVKWIEQEIHGAKNIGKFQIKQCACAVSVLGGTFSPFP